ncbi:hypothetical protein HZA85_02640 [Candidatus Uhrbacteria bacterium]|nr:hypothetical protein [Candidatus Uhrbacteria bacterium]
MNPQTQKLVNDIVEDLRFGFLEEVLKTLGDGPIPSEILDNNEVRDAAIGGITQHLLDSRSSDNFETAIKIRDLFRVPNRDIEEVVKQGIENWTMDKGPKFGQRICDAFGVPKEFMNTKNVQEAQERFSRLQQRQKEMRSKPNF